jgi:hypothetical protein
MHAMSDRPEFVLAWNDYRRRRRWSFGVWLGGFLFLALLVGLLSSRSLLNDLVFWVLGLTWIVAFLVADIRLACFRCPRCHHMFFWGLWYSNPFARKCLHCGLLKWSNSDSPPPS